MMVSVQTHLRQFKRKLRRLVRDNRVRMGMKLALLFFGGFFFSAASLREVPQPLAMGLVCALPGWKGVVIALGSIAGYPAFWGREGFPGLLWVFSGLLLAYLPGEESRKPALRCALGAFLVSAAGLGFQLLGQDTPFPIYLLQISVGGTACVLIPHLLQHRSAIGDWVLGGIGVLALSNARFLSFWNLGATAGAMLAVSGAFPAAALAGLGMDLARISPVPMGAVLCLAYFARLNPVRSKWIRYGAPGVAGLCVMLLCGVWDLSLLPGLVLGGALGLLLPPKPELQHRRGETGLAQVRLEVAAGALAQTQQLLLEGAPLPIDEEALLQKAIDRACGSCSARNACMDRQRLTVNMLRDPNLFQCRKTGRIRTELQQSREQYKILRSQRQQQEQCRWAVIRQYQFLADYLRNLADQLPRRGQPVTIRFRVEVSGRSRCREEANGDRCAAFSGGGCKYYVLLCDGMGTGMGAAEEAGTAIGLLKKMLTGGFTADQAFQSLNSLLILRDRAGAVTLDLAEIRLDTGRVTLYKWGAAASLILRKNRIEKAGTATLPPGLSVNENREEVIRLSLRRGETLILLSDGIEVGETLCRESLLPELPPGELAERILGCASGEDDATAVVIRLRPGSLPTS